MTPESAQRETDHLGDVEGDGRRRAISRTSLGWRRRWNQPSPCKTGPLELGRGSPPTLAAHKYWGMTALDPSMRWPR